MLVLDDLHAIANPACLDVLAALCEHVPAGSLIATASREEPNLPLARWRTQGRLHEIGVADLRLDQQEAAALLSGAGVALDPTEVADLTERTEGWPAGLYLAALSLQAGAPDPAPAMVFAGDDRLVSEYFRFEVLSRLPEAEARFLTHTSVLERMCGGLCDAVLETTRSAATLESLVRSNSFVVPLDRRGEWYRYHHLFGELLRSELERREPETVATLNARAMAWCVANDLPEAAVLYGQAAGETAAVAGLVDRLALSLHYGGRLETLEQWLEWFDDDDLVRFPAIAVFGAWARALTGRSAEAQRWLSLADGATSAIPLSDGSATIEPWVATLRAAMMADGVERALADAERALELLPPGSDWRATALCRPRHRPGAARRRRSGASRPRGGRRRGAGQRRRGGVLHRAGASSRCSRRGRTPGTRPGARHGGRRRWSRRRASATTRRAPSCTSRRRASRSMRGGRRMPARR